MRRSRAPKRSLHGSGRPSQAAQTGAEDRTEVEGKREEEVNEGEADRPTKRPRTSACEERTDSSSTTARYYRVVYAKTGGGKKKAKAWLDGALVWKMAAGALSLFDARGREVPEGKDAKQDEPEEGSELQVGPFEVEIDEAITKEAFDAMQPERSTTIPTKPAAGLGKRPQARLSAKLSLPPAQRTEANTDDRENRPNEERGQEQKEMDQTLYFNVLFRKGKKGPATDGILVYRRGRECELRKESGQPVRNGTGFVQEANMPSEGDTVTLGPYTVDIGESFAVEEFHLLLHCQKEDRLQRQSQRKVNGASLLNAKENIGNKLLKLMGWNGGGLGKDGSGPVAPVEVTTKFDRAGLGYVLPSRHNRRGHEDELYYD